MIDGRVVIIGSYMDEKAAAMDYARASFKYKTTKKSQKFIFGGLNLKGIKSGLGEKSSESFLYVKDLREYPNGDPGPGLVAGVRPYDLLLRINGVEIDAISDVKRAIEGKKTVQCEVRRMIRQLTVGRHRKLSLDDPLSDSGVHEETLVVTRTGGESLGLSLSEAYGGGSDTPVLIVTKVRIGSLGERVGIRARDIIWRIQQKPVLHLHDLKELIAGLDKFEITVRRES